MADTDSARLRELGYEQQLERRLRLFDNVALGFAGISPVVGLYAVVVVGTLVAGPAWIWVLPVALAGQCLLLGVYTQLVRDFPITGGAYQWTRRLVGPRYGWFTGWVAVCAYAVANTTVAYLGAPWALALLGIEPSANLVVVTAMVLVVICAIAGVLGVGVLSRMVKVGVAAEAVAMVGIGLVLLLAFRDEPFSLLTASFDRSGMLAALAVGGWVFIGFDVVVGAAEETKQAERHIPRAIWVSLLCVAGVVMLNAVAIGLSGEGEVTAAVVSSFGSWSDKPFAAVVLVAFLACGMAAQALTARAMFSIARDGVLPGSRLLSTVDRRKSPIGAIAVTAVVACLGLLLGLNSAAVGTLIAFGTAAIYVSFLLIASGALYARLRGRWAPAGWWGLAVNVGAVAWLAFETVNIAWPRKSIAPPDAPAYQVWAAPIVLTAIAVIGLAYLLIARPTAPLAEAGAERDEHGADGAVEHARAAAAP